MVIFLIIFHVSDPFKIIENYQQIPPEMVDVPKEVAERTADGSQEPKITEFFGFGSAYYDKISFHGSRKRFQSASKK